jgi:hypothetical protein
MFYISYAYFLVLLIIGVSAYGLTGQFSYFRRSYMNTLNTLISILETLYFIPGSQDNKILSFLIMLKCLRVINIIDFSYRYSKNMRLTIVSFLKLLPKIMSMLLIMFFCLCFFGMLLTHAYGASFYNCVNFEDSAKIVTEGDCYEWGGDWVQEEINASNLFDSLFYMFLIATTEGWSSLMFTAASLKG